MTVDVERKIRQTIDSLSLPEQIKLFGVGEGRSRVTECKPTSSMSIKYENAYRMSLNRPRPDEIKITEILQGLRHSIFVSADVKELWTDLESGSIIDMKKTVCIDDMTCRVFSNGSIKSIMITDKDDRFIKYILL